MTGPTDSADARSEGNLEADSDSDSAAASDATESATGEAPDESPERKHSTAREIAILAAIALVLYYVTLTFIARPYLIPSESMEPTLHGCAGCVGDRIMVDKVTYRFSKPEPGDVVVFKGPPSWNVGYKSIRSDNTAIRWVQNALSFVGFVPPDENDLVKRVIAVGGQTVQCRADSGLTVDGKRLNEPYLDPATMMADPGIYPCLGPEFGPVTVPQDRLWVLGDNRTHSADSRFHCTNLTEDTRPDARERVLCTGDPMAGTVPVENVIGKARFIAWPPSRWGGINGVNPQTNS